MKVLSSLVAAMMVVVAPTGAIASTLEEHKQLVRDIQSVNVKVFANESFCDRPENDRFLGAYHPGWRAIVICQENAKEWNGKLVPFTPEDYDTLRHEAHHLLQDCLDGSVDGRLDLLFTGSSRQRFLAAYPLSEQNRIRRVYGLAGADEELIQLEIEAFAVAQTVPASTIGKAVKNTCSGR